MAISLNEIYQPFSAFFIQKFGRPDGGTVSFRFAQLPIALADTDLIDPLHPELGPSPAAAVEQTSFIVDGVPRLDDAGRGVWLDPPRFSELYFNEMLEPSRPSISAAEVDRASAVDAFAAVKATARLRWEQGEAASGNLTIGEIRLSPASPVNWWRKDDPAWVHNEFVIQGGVTNDPPPSAKHSLSPEQLKGIVNYSKQREAQPIRKIGPLTGVALNTEVRKQIRLAAVTLPNANAPLMRAQLAGAVLKNVSPRLSEVAIRELVAAPQAAAAPPPVQTAQPAKLIVPERDLAVFRADYRTVPLELRVDLTAAVDAERPVQPIVIPSVTISFDYCLVNINRPWLHNTFIQLDNWFLPGLSQGELTKNDGRGSPALLVGFVALKNLQIKAPWTPADVTSLEESSQFGPFNFDSRVVNGAIGHEGIQIVGWLLQDLPDLPPQATAVRAEG